jgi:hypothetical protein
MEAVRIFETSVYFETTKNYSCPTTRHGGAWGGERMYSSYSFSTSALDGGEWSASRSGRALAPGKGPPVPTVQEAGWDFNETAWLNIAESCRLRTCRRVSPKFHITKLGFKIRRVVKVCFWATDFSLCTLYRSRIFLFEHRWICFFLVEVVKSQRRISPNTSNTCSYKCAGTVDSLTASNTCSYRWAELLHHFPLSKLVPIGAYEV